MTAQCQACLQNHAKEVRIWPEPITPDTAVQVRRHYERDHGVANARHRAVRLTVPDGGPTTVMLLPEL